jgi:hypothetical protein
MASRNFGNVKAAAKHESDQKSPAEEGGKGRPVDWFKMKKNPDALEKKTASELAEMVATRIGISVGKLGEQRRVGSHGSPRAMRQAGR